MPALPTTGEIRFSAIGTEFEDEYSLTDNTKTIRLSHYYANIQDIPTNHINTFPDSFNEFKLSLFHGKAKFVEESSDDEEPSPTDAPPPEKTVPFPDPEGGTAQLGNVTYEWAQGLEVTNITGSARNADNAYNYFKKLMPQQINMDTSPETILQAKRGDKIKVKTFQYTGGYWQWVIIWLYTGSSWLKLDVKVTNSSSHEFNNRYTIDLAPGNYAIGLSINYYSNGENHKQHRSWRAFSLHVWG